MSFPETDLIADDFFIQNAVEPDLYDENWDYMKNHGVYVYDKIEQIPCKKVPDFITRSYVGNCGGTVIGPNSDWNSILIPFSPLDHDQQYFKDTLISDIIQPLIQGEDSKKKFIASCRSWYFFFAETKNITYEVLHRIAGPNEIIPFILFDESLSYCFGFDFDFEYAFFTAKDLEPDDTRLRGTYQEWDNYFKEHFSQKFSKNTFHQELFENVFCASVPRLRD